MSHKYRDVPIHDIWHGDSSFIIQLKTESINKYFISSLEETKTEIIINYQSKIEDAYKNDFKTSKNVFDAAHQNFLEEISKIEEYLAQINTNLKKDDNHYHIIIMAFFRAKASLKSLIFMSNIDTKFKTIKIKY